MTRGPVVVVAALLAAVVSVAGGCANREPFQRVSDEEARARGDALAHRMVDALGGDAAWRALSTIRFTFDARFFGVGLTTRHHVWDKARGLARVTTGDEGDETVVWLRLADRTGVVERAGVRVPDPEEAADALADAYAAFINDSYWLAAPFKVFDPGAVRAAIDDRLRVTFEPAVGLTPGDAYLYELAPDGMPRGWSFLLESGLAGTFEFKEPVVFDGVTLFGKKTRPASEDGIAFPSLDATRALDDAAFAPLLDAGLAPSR